MRTASRRLDQPSNLDPNPKEKEVSRTIAHEHPESRKERARERRKAFRAVNLLWALEITDDQDHARARRFLRLKYKS